MVQARKSELYILVCRPRAMAMKRKPTFWKFHSKKKKDFQLTFPWCTQSFIQWMAERPVLPARFSQIILPIKKAGLSESEPIRLQKEISRPPAWIKGCVQWEEASSKKAGFDYFDPIPTKHGNFRQFDWTTDSKASKGSLPNFQKLPILITNYQ